MDAPAPRSQGLGPLVRVRLWLSYQRYALLVTIGSAGLFATALVLLPKAWWLWGPLALLCLPALALAHHIHRGHRAKIVETHRGLRKIRQGSFEPESVQHLCSDPCSKIVARELLAQHGMPWSERRKLLARLTLLEEEASKSLVIVDRTNGKVYRYEEGQISSQDLHPQSANSEESE